MHKSKGLKSRPFDFETVDSVILIGRFDFFDSTYLSSFDDTTSGDIFPGHDFVSQPHAHLLFASRKFLARDTQDGRRLRSFPSVSAAGVLCNNSVSVYQYLSRVQLYVQPRRFTQLYPARGRTKQPRGCAAERRQRHHH